MPTIEVDGKEYSGERLYREEAVLRELYVERGLSQAKVAEKLNSGETSIGRWLDRLGIEKRTRSEAHTNAARRTPAAFRTKESGHERWEHYYEGETTHFPVHRLLAIAEFGADAVSGMDTHHKNGVPWDNRPENIELLTRGEHVSHHNRLTDAPWQDKARLEQAYENNSIRGLSNMWDCDYKTIRSALKEFGIERHSYGWRGDSE